MISLKSYAKNFISVGGGGDAAMEIRSRYHVDFFFLVFFQIVLSSLDFFVKSNRTEALIHHFGNPRFEQIYD